MIASLGKAYYSEALSASQRLGRYREFNISADAQGGPISKAAYKIALLANPQQGDSLSVDETVYTFVNSVTKPREIQIGPDAATTTTNIATKLINSKFFPVYFFETQVLTPTLITIIGRQPGSFLYRNVVSSSSDIVINPSEGTDRYNQHIEHYKIGIQVYVNGFYYTTIHAGLADTYDSLNDIHESKIRVDFNSILKDAVYTEYPEPETTLTKQNSCASVSYTFYDVYKGYNGLKEGEYLQHDDGFILNSRGEDVYFETVDTNLDGDVEDLDSGIYERENLNSLKHLIPNSSTYSDLLLDKKPVGDKYIYSHCAGNPFPTYWYLNDYVVNSDGPVASEFPLDDQSIKFVIKYPDSSFYAQPLSSYDGEGIYMIDVSELVTLAGYSSGTCEAYLGYYNTTYSPDPNNPINLIPVSTYLPITKKLVFTLDGGGADSSCSDPTEVKCSDKEMFLYLNRYGVYEPMYTEKRYKEDMDILSSVGTTCSPHTAGIATNYKMHESSHTVKHSTYKWITNKDVDALNHLKSFLYSAKVFYYNDDGILQAVKINTKTRTIKFNNFGKNLRVRIQFEPLPSIISIR